MSQAEAQNAADLLHAPHLDLHPVGWEGPPVPQDPKLRREHAAYLQLLPDLLRTHHGQFVAVHEGRVIESGSNKIAVARQAYARCGYVPIYVHLVTDQPVLPERIPSLRCGCSEPMP